MFDNSISWIKLDKCVSFYNHADVVGVKEIAHDLISNI